MCLLIMLKDYIPLFFKTQTSLFSLFRVKCSYMNIPKTIQTVLSELERKGFQAFVVGGCVRDIILKRIPNDWDITTNADPEQIQEIFKNNFKNNDFGTVTIITDDKAFKHIEITPFRSESAYSDNRHPDIVKWADKIEDDLSRRDFTINAIAIDNKGQIVDPYSGQQDIADKIIKTVGNADTRFNEDALRLMRAIRFSAVLGFEIEEKTWEAIKKNHSLIKNISYERIRDEFVKLIKGKYAAKGIELLRKSGILEIILPELIEGCGVDQNRHHIYDCYEHAIKSFEYAVEKDFNWYVRLAALIHDIGKPKSKRGEGEKATFYGHEVVGAKKAAKIMERFKFSNKDIEKIVTLVRYHMFYYNTGEVTESSVRRLLKNVGKENAEDLLLLRQADRIGSGTPKAEPYKLRHLKYIIDKVSTDPISAKMLKINGNNLINELKVEQGPKIGQIIDILLDKVLEDPGLNTKEYLIGQAKELSKLSVDKLVEMRKTANKQISQAQEREDTEMKKKYWVQ